jgi:hypothetical protein
MLDLDMLFVTCIKDKRPRERERQLRRESI